jgi:hypothetical protein
MVVRLKEWVKPLTWWDWIEITANNVLNLLLRSENNLIKINEDHEAYVDLQLEDWIEPDADFPVGVTTGRVLLADWWVATGTMLCFKTTSGDYVTWIYWDDGKLYIDNWTGTFKQIYLKSEVDALFSTLRGELSTVAFTGDYDDLLNKPTLWTAAGYDVGSSAWEIPVIQNNWQLDPNIVPTVISDIYTVTNVEDLITLSNAVKWDYWIVTSVSKTYILSQDPYSVQANWVEMLTPTSSVTSVNTKTWAVTLTTTDIAEWDTSHQYVTSNEKNDWNNKLGSNSVATVALTGNYNDLNNKPTIDTAMSDSSTNAVQNKIIKAYVDSTAWSSAASVISDTAYGSSWDWDTTHAPSKNVLYDEMSTMNTNITNLQTDVTNIQTSLGSVVSDTAFWSSWDGDTTHAPSKNAVYDVLWDVETLLANL